MSGWNKVLGEFSGTTRALKSCWAMLRRIWNLNKSEGNTGKSAAKENNLLKMDLQKTSKLENVKSNCADTNRRNDLFLSWKSGGVCKGSFLKFETHIARMRTWRIKRVGR